MKRALPVLVVCVALAGAPLARASHAWANFHWARSSNPISLQVVDSVVGTWDPLLRTVAAEWGASSVLNMSVPTGSSGLLARLICAPAAGKIRACNANYGPTGWFGVAQVWLGANGHITQATTKVNDFYFVGTYGNNVARRHVLCQEIGHDVGLDHHNQASCMNDANNTLNKPSHLSPNAHDYAQLASIYAHLDGGAKIGPRASPAARPTFVQRIGDQTLLTFVRWVS